ncbi:MAG: hypothetical protein B6D68_02135 [spirochete symbiont of Stewartia floridana]|nr:MAG: hypothetical protein B6D68_02135 [spirochete symbiont of Stewartia floridana]
MMLAKVLGHAVCTIKSPMYHGEKLLLLRRMKPDGELIGGSFLAVDAVQAGPGDCVLVIDEGGSARQILGKAAMGPIRTVIAGIIDEVTLEG